MNYGTNPDVDKMIQLEAESIGWTLTVYTQPSLIETDDVDAPFVTTVEYAFRHPNHEIYRRLVKTYIFDGENLDWVPLLKNVTEWDLRTDKIKTITSSYLWQGDYDIPFFKQ